MYGLQLIRQVYHSSDKKVFDPLNWSLFILFGGSLENNQTFFFLTFRKILSKIDFIILNISE